MDEKEERQLLYGRELLEEEVSFPLKTNNQLKDIQSRPGISENCCARCGSHRKEDFHYTPCTCGDHCLYCLRCIQMGRIQSCSRLFHLPEGNQFKPIEGPVLTWEGELSAQQKMASSEIVQTIQQKDTHLVWAVAGAGKTEMLFEGVAYALKNGKRVCIASPRVDVCLELAPRLKQAFQSVDMITLYGDMEDAYRYTQLVIATTHQLLRFREAFDVLIIDEIDAFPFHGDEVLHRAAQKARKKESALLYLTATPDTFLQKRADKGQLKATILPARYHGYSLPVPKLVWAGNWRKHLLKFPSISPVIKKIKQLVSAERRFLVFVPNIEWMKQLEKTLRKLFPEAVCESVYSSDPQRKEKVLWMRQEKLDFLLTSTILERGVTFRDIDVLVVGSEDQTFTESALVQISGRVGRHADYPTGEVVFFHYGKSAAMKRAVKQITYMNHLAKERGLIRQ